MAEICNTRHRTEDDWADAFFRANEIHDELAHAGASAWDYVPRAARRSQHYRQGTRGETS